MERVREWLKQPYGKKLRKLHAWNAGIVLILAITGIILPIEAIRGDLGVVRVWLKQIHIYAGILSVLVILLYLPLLAKHLKQLKGKLPQQWNLGIVLFILLGWSVSGLIMWQYRNLPTYWSNTAVTFHDLFSWVGIPYALYHSISRSRWLRQEEVLERREAMLAAKLSVKGTSSASDASQTAASSLTAYGKSEVPTAAPDDIGYQPRRYSRRTFIRGSVFTVMVLVIGPYLYRFVKRVFDSGGASLEEFAVSDGNRMVPALIPTEESVKLAAGGARGTFRVYSVTPIPSFSSDDWEFSVYGLVNKPVKYNWADFSKITRKVQVSDFHCVTGWSVYNGTWEGIPLSQLLNTVQVKSTAKIVKFYSGDGVYTDTLTIKQAWMDDILVAVMFDGKPIPQKLGGPVRLLVPQMYAYKSVKWLSSIELINKDHIGYWEARGYDTDAWVGAKGKT